MTGKDVFAIRVGDYVELRAANNPPQAKVSKLTKTITIKAGSYVPDGDWGFDRYVEKDVKKKVTLTQVFYIGGAVLGYMKHYKFVSFLKGKPLKKDAIIQLGPDLSAMIISREWRRKNL